MQAPKPSPVGSSPAADGDVTRFEAAEVSDKAWFNRTRTVLFVNGMLNSPEDHSKSATGLSVLQCCPVIGVYNRSDGFWQDLGQCITDKAKLVGVQAEVGLNFQNWVRAVDALYQDAKANRPGLTKVAFVGDMISSNKATHALFSLIAGAGGLEKPTIYSHSQGNLIVSNALTAVALAQGPAAINGIEVNSFGSPCRYWPQGVKRTNYAFTFDPVSWLDLRTDLTSSKIGFVAAHGFDVYLKHDAEFIVNRFRWGSFGMTVSLDEVGLAAFMVRMGNNPRRLKAILERLYKAHWSDSDDVALLYVRSVSDADLRSLKFSDPSVIDLLIQALETGWTTADEKAAIDRLRAL